MRFYSLLFIAIYSMFLSIFFTTAASALGWKGSYVKPPIPQPASSSLTSSNSSANKTNLFHREFYLTPLMVGYESNYRLSSSHAEGSALWSLEGGMEARYQFSSKLRMFAELNGMVRVPFGDSGLTEYHGELPLLFFYRIHPRLELFVSNYTALERAKTPPIFLDIDPSQVQLLSTIRYFSAQDTVRPALAFYLNDSTFAELGIYLRGKKVTFIGDAVGEPDYSLFDVGLDLNGKYFYENRLSLRLKYDLAWRSFNDYSARPSSYAPALNENLTMQRHLLSMLWRFKIYGPLSAFAEYAIRFTLDNGSYFDSREHLPNAGLSLQIQDKIQANVSLAYFHRTYLHRTPCEAQEFPVDSNNYGGSDCQPIGPNLQSIPLVQNESAWVVNAQATYLFNTWLQAILSYELNMAASDVTQEIKPNHRIMGGIGMRVGD